MVGACRLRRRVTHGVGLGETRELHMGALLEATAEMGEWSVEVRQESASLAGDWLHSVRFRRRGGASARSAGAVG